MNNYFINNKNNSIFNMIDINKKIKIKNKNKK